jgi:PAS domain S-box-containing protein
MSLLDTRGRVLVGVGWQDICTRFHRVQPETARHCLESDTHLAAGLAQGECRLYKCKNNLWDMATPINVAGRHMGNIFTGQFFFEDETIDRELFRAQALKYGFDEEGYLAALDRVPRLSRETVERGMGFFCKLADMLSQLGYSNIKFARLLAERERLSDSLGESRARLEAALASMTDAVFISDGQGRFIEFNDAFATFYRFRNKEECSARLAEHPDLLEVFMTDGTPMPQDQWAVPRALRGETATSAEYLLQRNDTGESWVGSYSFGPIRDKAGQIIGAVVVSRDITERRRVEEALQESELFHRQALESIPGMMFTTRPDGYCDYQSQQWADFTGVPMSEHLGDGWNRLLHPDDRPRAFAAWRSAVEERGPYDLEYRVRRHDGEYLWFKVRGRPIRNETGEIVRWFGMALNIDQLVRTQEELRQAKTTAEAATRAKSEFLANMSHEIRTPMTVFMSALEHLLQLDQDPQRRHLLGLADQSAKRLRTLIDDILDFSRIEARRVDLEQEPFDLRACLEEAVKMFALAARDKKLRLETRVAPEVPPIVVGDSARLGQVLTNLIGNAVKFTHEGEISVSMAPRGGLLEFVVADTGIGIPEEKCELIFESFSQADGSLSRRYGGTGLGLAICKSLVELMGGEIFARSSKGRGSVFSFTLPLKPAGRNRPAPAEPAPEIATGSGSPARILLAEDEPLIREMIVMMLASRGWQAETAGSGRVAVEKWAKGDFNILLMDLQMPEMNGLQATREIRKRERETGKRTCIIGLTAHSQREIRDDCLTAGMDRVLTKPVRMTDLCAAIDSCLTV